MKIRRIPWLTILVLAILPLLAISAVLQYNWLGTVKKAERGKLKRDLFLRTTQLLTELSTETGTISRVFQMKRRDIEAGDLTPLLNRYRFWLETTTFPDIVREIIYADDNSRFYRLGASRNGTAYDVTVSETEPGGAYDSVIAAIEELDYHTLPGTSGYRLLPEYPALVTPLLPDAAGTFRSASGAFELTPSSGVICILLDREYLASVYFPYLVNLFFGGLAKDEYLIRISEENDTGGDIYRSHSGDEKEEKELLQSAPEIRAKLFRMNWLTSIARGRVARP